MKKNNMPARHEAAIAGKLKAEYDAKLHIALQMGLDAAMRCSGRGRSVMENKKRLTDVNPIIRNLTAMKSMYDAIALDGMIKALEEAPAVDAAAVLRDQWFSVKDKLPETEEEVLVLTVSKTGNVNVDKGYLLNGRFVHRGSAVVTHWMPLPVPPEVGK